MDFDTMISFFTSGPQRLQQHPLQTPSWSSPPSISVPSVSYQPPGTKCALLSPAEALAEWTHLRETLRRLAAAAAVDKEEQTKCKIVEMSYLKSQAILSFPGRKQP